MTSQWKLALVAAFVFAYGAAVWHIHSWFNASKAVAELIREDAATKDKMRASSAIDTSFSESIAKLHQLELSANQQIEAAHETTDTNCALGPRRLSILKQAIAVDPPAR